MHLSRHHRLAVLVQYSYAGSILHVAVTTLYGYAYVLGSNLEAPMLSVASRAGNALTSLRYLR